MRGPEKGHIYLQFKDSTVFRRSQWISPNYFNKFPLPCQNKKARTFRFVLFVRRSPTLGSNPISEQKGTDFRQCLFVLAQREGFEPSNGF